MPCIAEYSAPSSSLTLLVIREKVAEGIQQKCMWHLLVMLQTDVPRMASPVARVYES